jgi:hypothetical protein
MLRECRYDARSRAEFAVPLLLPAADLVMRPMIAVNASFFNTHRIVQQYASTAYL